MINTDWTISLLTVIGGWLGLHWVCWLAITGREVTVFSVITGGRAGGEAGPGRAGQVLGRPELIQPSQAGREVGSEEERVFESKAGLGRASRFLYC